jgi:hypothetical protein
MNNCIGNEYPSIGDAYAGSGNSFLVIELKVVNNGYESFSVDPGYFKLATPNFNYKISPVTYYLDKIGKRTLPSGSIPNGGAISGCVAYEVPSRTSGYNIRYDGWEKVNIEYNCD